MSNIEPRDRFSHLISPDEVFVLALLVAAAIHIVINQPVLEYLLFSLANNDVMICDMIIILLSLPWISHENRIDQLLLFLCV